METAHLNKICRTCLCEGDLVSINTNFLPTSTTFHELLTKFLHLKLADNKILPMKICSNCVTELGRIYTFMTKCTDSEKELEKYLPPPESDNKQEDIQEGETSSKQENNTSEILGADENLTHNEDSMSSVETVRVFDDSLDESSNSNRTFICGTCLLEFDSRILLAQHREKEKHVKLKKFKCKLCSQILLGDDLFEHMKIHIREKLYDCDYCDVKFRSREYLHVHKMFRHEDRTTYVYCYFCFKLFENIHFLHKHLNNHNLEFNKCGGCDKEFDKTVELLEHIKMHENDKTLICTVCNKNSKNAKKFINHLKKHNGRLCKTAQKKDSEPESKNNLTCKLCKMIFINKLKLKEHVKSHLKEKKFLCSECGKMFLRIEHLQSHSVCHSKLKPFECEHCQKSFPRLHSLRRHIVTHNGLKQYMCPICNKAFSQSQHVKRHMMCTHNEQKEKPFTCSVCAKGFMLKENLTVHMRIHTGETPFVCDVCDKGFYDSSSMKKHKKSHFKE